jgi:signal transduction histidine kinase
MSIFQSLRWRIQMWHGLLLLAVVGGFCGLAYRLQADNASRHANSELRLRVDALTTRLGESGTGVRPPVVPPRFDTVELRSLFDDAGDEPFYFCIWRRDGALLNVSTAAPPDVPRPVRSEASPRTRGEFREAFVFTPPGECLLVGRSLAPVERELRGFALWLGAVGLGALALALAGGWWFSTRALRPMRDIERAAMRAAGGDLGARIPISKPGSELGRLSVALNETFARLEDAFGQQARFTSDAAHELRTPVSLILAQSQLALGRERSPGEYRDTIETSQRAARRMHALIESLLALARLDAGVESLRRRPCDLAELAREHLELILPLAEENRIRLRGDFARAPCEADPERIGQVLVNLLGNAVKFSPPGGEVRLSTRREGGDALVSVEDHGPGIAPEHLPHIFERFYRVDASRARATGGAGLGLAICRGIAEAHGGSITVESRPGKGSRFTLRIPSRAGAGD